MLPAPNAATWGANESATSATTTSSTMLLDMLDVAEGYYW